MYGVEEEVDASSTEIETQENNPIFAEGDEELLLQILESISSNDIFNRNVKFIIILP